MYSTFVFTINEGHSEYYDVPCSKISTFVSWFPSSSLSPLMDNGYLHHSDQCPSLSSETINGI